MKPNTYDLRQFQEELAALDRKTDDQAKERPIFSKESAHARFAQGQAQAQAQAEFMILRERYGLTVADVVAFFPEEEGIAYLQALIATKEAKPKQRRSKSLAQRTP